MNLPFVTDSHCHLDHVLSALPELSLSDLVEQANAQGVKRLLNVCIELKHFDRVLNPALEYDHIYASAGQHPCDCDGGWSFEQLCAFAQHEKVIAIGETGLDYFHQETAPELQQESFVAHMTASKQLKKPLIIHTRDARKDTISLLSEHADRDVAGVMHCFTEDWSMAKQALDLGFYISFSGIVTFKNASNLRDVAKKVPLDRLLIETDAPYLAPVPHRGKTNQPAFVTHVGHAIASLRFMTYEALAEATNHNFEALFLRHKHEGRHGSK